MNGSSLYCFTGIGGESGMRKKGMGLKTEQMIRMWEPVHEIISLLAEDDQRSIQCFLDGGGKEKGAEYHRFGPAIVRLRSTINRVCV